MYVILLFLVWLCDQTNAIYSFWKVILNFLLLIQNSDMYSV